MRRSAQERYGVGGGLSFGRLKFEAKEGARGPDTVAFRVNCIRRFHTKAIAHVYDQPDLAQS